MKTNIKSFLDGFFAGKSIAILGFGKEGQSTYKFIRSYYSQLKVCIADTNEAISEHGLLKCDDKISFELGDGFLENIKTYDIVIKTPGISFKDYQIPENQIVTSQTDIFLRLFSEQTVGITGTKGKSTVVSLLHFILQKQNKDVVLVGNIGIPALDKSRDISENTIIIYELSSHQLEFINNSPHIAVLLNLYEEHLDHYNSYKEYRYSKWNILKHQKDTDHFIYCADEEQIAADIADFAIGNNRPTYSLSDKSNADIHFAIDRLNFSGVEIETADYKLLGYHNINNLMATLLVCRSLKLNLMNCEKAAFKFNGLEHRLEYVAEIDSIKFYNDSIATIPQATIKAIESVLDIETVILGGFDRGIDYTVLVDFLMKFRPLNLLFVGEVGKQLYDKLCAKQYRGRILPLESFDDFYKQAIGVTNKDKSVVLSPAASSYDMFKNFEERGDRFKSIVLENK